MADRRELRCFVYHYLARILAPRCADREPVGLPQALVSVATLSGSCESTVIAECITRPLLPAMSQGLCTWRLVVACLPDIIHVRMITIPK